MLFLSIKKNGQSVFKDKGSKHLGFTFYIQDENQAKEIVKNLKHTNKGATHVCFAFVLGENGQLKRFSDDGEPTNTAGKPILNQIIKGNLTHTLVAVVRYFGGTKLGVSGLINAYRTAAQLAIENSETAFFVVTKQLTVTFNYPDIEKVRRIIQQYQLEIVNEQFDLNCRFTLKIPVSLLQNITNQLQLIENIYIIS